MNWLARKVSSYRGLFAPRLHILGVLDGEVLYLDQPDRCVAGSLELPLSGDPPGYLHRMLICLVAGFLLLLLYLLLYCLHLLLEPLE